MQNANRQLIKTGKQFKKTGRAMTVGLTAPLLAIGGLSVKIFADFEQAMAKVNAISGATASEFKLLEASAKELGRTTRYTSAEVAQLELNLSKLGFNPQEILDSTAAILDLALATGEDLAQSATVAAGTLRGFGLDAKESGRVVDVMAKSFASSALDLEKFSTAMSVLAPVAKNAGVSIEGATGMLAVLVNAGIDASTAGTGLRNIFLDIAGSGESLESALGKIANSTNKNKVAFDLFGKRGATVAAVLADNYDAAKDFESAFNDAGGTAKKMATIMDDTLTGSLFKLKSATEGAMISIGDKLAPTINSLATYVTDLATKFTNLSESTQKTILVIAGIAAAIGPVLLTLGYLMTNVIPGLITVFGALRVAILTKVVPAFQALIAVIAANPILALITVLVAAGAALYKYAGASNRAAAAQERLNKAVEDGKNKAQKYKEISNASTQKQIDLIKENAREEIAKTNNEKKIGEIRKKALKDVIDLLEKERVKVGENVKAYATASQEYAKDSPKRVEYNAIIKAEAAYYDELGTRIRSLTIDKLELATANNTLSEGGGGRPKAESVVADGLQQGVALNPLGEIASNLPETGALINGVIDQYIVKVNEASEASYLFADAIGNSFATLGNILAETFQTGNAIFDSFISTIINGLSQLAAAFVQNLILEKTVSLAKRSIDIGTANRNAIVIGTNAAAALGPLGLPLLPGLIASSMATVNTAFASIAAFADGGIVSGPTYALVGEYAGASNNPEVIAPLDKLKDLIQPQGAETVIVGGKIEAHGDVLRVVLDRADKSRSRRG